MPQRTDTSDNISLSEQLVERASRCPDPAVTVISLLRTLSTYIHYTGRNEGTDLHRIMVAGTDHWLDDLANVIELDTSITTDTLT